MFVIRFSRLSMTGAEDLVARIWFALEEHNVVAPRLSVEPYRDGALNIQFTFRTKHEAELITRAAPLLVPVNGSKTPSTFAGVG
jgi:hypothetical protein